VGEGPKEASGCQKPQKNPPVCSPVCVLPTEEEEAKKEEEAKPQQTPEERAAEIAEVERQLEALEDRKHRYFLGLKKAPASLAQSPSLTRGTHRRS
jgi:molecular chaperone GrpE (heat shock protein)